MFVLDTDRLTLIDRHGTGRSPRLLARLEKADPDSLAATAGWPGLDQREGAVALLDDV